MMKIQDDVLELWFPVGLDRDREAHLARLGWWFRGGADDAIQAGVFVHQRPIPK